MINTILWQYYPALTNIQWPTKVLTYLFPFVALSHCISSFNFNMALNKIVITLSFVLSTAVKGCWCSYKHCKPEAIQIYTAVYSTGSYPFWLIPSTSIRSLQILVRTILQSCIWLPQYILRVQSNRHESRWGKQSSSSSKKRIPIGQDKYEASQAVYRDRLGVFLRNGARVIPCTQ